MLAREGLSIKSTMREVKEVKKRRKMEQELDGIDTKNIVAGTARNKPTAATAKPKTQVNGGGTAAAAADHTKPPVSTNSTKTTAAPSTTAPAPSKASSAATTAAAAKPPAGTTAAPKAAEGRSPNVAGGAGGRAGRSCLHTALHCTTLI